MAPVPLTRFRRALRRWHSRHGRDLPWRNSGDPYRVWISEIMLQQTTVAAVVPYFERFTQRFPTLEDLAAADEQDVLRLWEGLGYYSRARNLFKAARLVVSHHEGRFPDDVSQLADLPGIGRYTAGAIASFAFNRPAPILEANTLRLYSRLLGFDGDPRSSSGQKLLWEFAARVVPPKDPGEFNQALMDLGATVCRPEPDCGQCPVRSCCRAFAMNRQREIPRPPPRPEITDLTEAAVAVERRGRYLLLRQQPGDRWAGLWDFVHFAVPETSANDWLQRELCIRANLRVRTIERLADLRHAVTRYRITRQCFAAQWTSGDPTCEHAWVPRKDFGRYPLSMPARRLATRLLSLQTGDGE